MDWVHRPQNDNGLYGILQTLQGSHLDNFPLKTLKLGWVAFHSLKFQLKCLDFHRFVENTLQRLAHFLCLAHPTKSDVTSGRGRA